MPTSLKGLYSISAYPLQGKHLFEKFDLIWECSLVIWKLPGVGKCYLKGFCHTIFANGNLIL